MTVRVGVYQTVALWLPYLIGRVLFQRSGRPAELRPASSSAGCSMSRCACLRIRFSPQFASNRLRIFPVGIRPETDDTAVSAHGLHAHGLAVAMWMVAPPRTPSGWSGPDFAGRLLGIPMTLGFFALLLPHCVPFRGRAGMFLDWGILFSDSLDQIAGVGPDPGHGCRPYICTCASKTSGLAERWVARLMKVDERGARLVAITSEERNGLFVR